MLAQQGDGEVAVAPDGGVGNGGMFADHVAVTAALPLIFADPDCRRLVLSYDPGNTRAGALYGRLGFVPCGTDHEGAPMMELLRP